MKFPALPPIACAALAAICLAGLAGSARGQDQPPPDPRLAEAQQLFDAASYKNAVATLDRLVPDLEARPSRDAATVAMLSTAYELRARSRIALGDTEGARSDFRSLLSVSPGFALATKASARVTALLEDVRKATIGSMVLNVSPADTELALDGQPFTAQAGPVQMLAGAHVLSGRRSGFGSASVPFTISPGAAVEVVLALERVAATVTLLTSPPGVEVVVDGVSRGETRAGPVTMAAADAALALGVPGDSLSRPFVLDDIPAGAHTFEFRRGCHVTAERRLEVNSLADFVLDPVKLERAVAAVDVDSTSPSGGATVLLDGQPRGSLPASLVDVCEGPHLVEIRSPRGRYAERITVRRGEKVTVRGPIRPAVALLGVGGLPEGDRGADLRLGIEKALAQVTAILVFAPPAEEEQQALKQEGLSRGWLAFDLARRPMGPTAAAMTPGSRLETSQRLARALDVQGIAELMPKPGGEPNEFLLTVLAAGSTEPDVIELTPDAPASIGAAAARLDAVPAFSRPSAGLAVIDVLDVTGAVVASVERGGPAGGAGLAPGDVIVAAGGQPVADGSAFAALVAQSKAPGPLAIAVRDRAGTVRQGELTLTMAPRLIALNDESWLSNALVLSLRARLASSSEGRGEGADSGVRLNLAVALMRVGNWSEALTELERVRLPSGPGVSSGTVQYLAGLCYEAMDRPADAEKSWRAAAADETSLVTEDGPPVKELAERKLAGRRVP